MASIYTYGDSITFGIGDTIGGGWATRIRNTMINRGHEKSSKRRPMVFNQARFAMTLSDMVDLQVSDFEHRPAQERGRMIALTMTGYGDSLIESGNALPNISPDALKEHLTRITDIATYSGRILTPVFVELPPMDLSRPHPNNPGRPCEQRMTEYQKIIQEHAYETGTLFIETVPTLEKLPDDPISQDGIHPSVAGHIALHDIVLSHIDELLST